ncbi:MAG: CBS domain-containing protein, partial [Candidatus Hermodarchaeia archaeon]
MESDRPVERVYRKVDKAFRQFLAERSEIRRVEQIMNKGLITIDDDASLLQAAKKMGEGKIGSLVVTRNDTPWGFVIDKDVLRILAEGKDPTQILIKDAMSTPLISIPPQATIVDAATRIILRGGPLVVFEGGTFIGVVSPSDIVKSLPE